MTSEARGYLFLDRSKFHEAFAADVAPDVARLMADSQVPWGVQALEGTRRRAGRGGRQVPIGLNKSPVAGGSREARFGLRKRDPGFQSRA